MDGKDGSRSSGGADQALIRLKPVTAESLAHFDAKTTVRNYWIVAVCLAVIIVPFSVMSFVSTALSTSVPRKHYGR